MTKAKIEQNGPLCKDIDQDVPKESVTLFTLSPAILTDDQRVVKNYWGKKVANPEVLISFKGIPVLRAGGKLIIKSLPKAGKTSLDESLIANWINPKSAPMGLTVKLYGRTKILFIDTEQSEYESQRSYNRIMKRCGFDLSLPDPPEEVKKLIHLNYKRLLPEEMIDDLANVLKANPEIGLLILDVVTDLSDDGVMDMKDALKVVKLLNSINEEIGIVCNIHVNANTGVQNSNSSRGHLGRELERKCSACIHLTKHDKDNIKVKIDLNRIGGEGESIFCTWNDKLEMFLESNYIPPAKTEIKEKDVIEIKQLFLDEVQQKTAVLKKRFFKLHPDTTVNNYNFYIKRWREEGLIDMVKKGLWKINDV